jgi:hypothetical protein
MRGDAPKFYWLWVALPACGSGLLMALTNQMSQDVAPMPLLWVAPLAVYLLTFILCFESQRFYRRWLFLPACFAGLAVLAWLLEEGYLKGFRLQVGGYLTILFLGCMVCHGELYAIRPPAARLTAYYLAISLGGALGGIFVALIAPAVFTSLLETPILAVLIAGLATWMLHRHPKTQPLPVGSKKIKGASAPTAGGLFTPATLAGVGTLVIGAAQINAQFNLREQSIHFARNFYGSYRVTESPGLLLNKQLYRLTHGEARILHSGQIYHGLQFTSPDSAGMATTYYCEEGGLGLAFRNLPANSHKKIGAVGLGAGTLAVYAQPGDQIRFYELNPLVHQIAETHFTFLTNCLGQVDVVLGDGRLSLEREPNQEFDLLVLDAFAGDSVPVHLLTEEAMRVYERHLKQTGVMAFHISNSHLDLEPVVRALADKLGWRALLVLSAPVTPEAGKLDSVWMLLSRNPAFFDQPEVRAQPNLSSRKPPLLWTDDHSSILPILQ